MHYSIEKNQWREMLKQNKNKTSKLLMKNSDNIIHSINIKIVTKFGVMLNVQKKKKNYVTSENHHFYCKEKITN